MKIIDASKPRDLDDLFEEGWKFKVGRIDGAGWFYAKETAEIAKAYGMACLHSYMKDEADKMERFENLFEEWSK